MEWTDDKINQLINLYEQHPCLYDVSDRTYHNRVAKKFSMAKIAEQLSTSGNEM